MIKLTEFYTEKQGRPESKITLDMDSRAPVTQYKYVTTLAFEVMEAEMKAELNEMLEKLTKMLIELTQVKLHLASLSDAPVTEEDGEG